MDSNRVDNLLKYALAVAGQEDRGNREVGPIHLVKYVYLADLAYSEKHEGSTYTGTPWQFHYFGPWSVEVYKRINPVIQEVGASERKISSPKYEHDFFRWILVDDDLFNELDKELPFEVAGAIKRAVHEFGDDTSGLLHYVYTTFPMLRGAPGELLCFDQPESKENQVETESIKRASPDARPFSMKNQKGRKAVIKNLREKLQASLSEKLADKRKAPAYTPPRYDEVFFKGQEWLDGLAGKPVESQEGQVYFSKGVWKSPSRTDSDVP